MSDDPDLEGAYALQTPDDNRRFYASWAEDYDESFLARTTYQLPALASAKYLDQGGTWPCSTSAAAQSRWPSVCQNTAR